MTPLKIPDDLIMIVDLRTYIKRINKIITQEVPRTERTLMHVAPKIKIDSSTEWGLWGTLPPPTNYITLFNTRYLPNLSKYISHSLLPGTVPNSRWWVRCSFTEPLQNGTRITIYQFIPLKILSSARQIPSLTLTQASLSLTMNRLPRLEDTNFKNLCFFIPKAFQQKNPSLIPLLND